MPRSGKSALGAAPDLRSSTDPSIEAVVGFNVRAERKRLNLTSLALAERAGISVGMLSRVEKGKAAPSLHVLRDLAAALNVPASKLLSSYGDALQYSYVPAGGGTEIEREGSRAGQRHLLLGRPMRGKLQVEPMLITITDESHPYTRFKHKGVEFIYMLKGRMSYRHGDAVVALKPGDSLFFEAGTFHGPESFDRLPIQFLSLIVENRK